MAKFSRIIQINASQKKPENIGFVSGGHRRAVAVFLRSFLTPLLAIAWLCFYLIPSATAGQSEQLRQRLVEMNTNAANLSYSGTLVYSRGDHMQTLKRFHTVKDGMRHERLVHLSGPQRETIRTGGKVTCLDANREARVFNETQAFSEESTSDILTRPFTQNLLSDQSAYELVHAGEARIAGREAVRLNLVPKDKYRYGFSLALDGDSNLLLQSLMLSETSQVLERIEYIEIDIGQPIDASLLAPAMTVETNPASATAPTVTITPLDDDWQVGWVPAGFMLQSARQGTVLGQSVVRDGGKTFGDGLSAFTVFLAKSINMGNQSFQSGATTAYSVVKNTEETVYSVTVVGEIPLIAAKKIAASVSVDL